VEAGAAQVGFGVWEARAPEPMLPVSLLRRPDFATPALLGLVLNVAFYGLIFVFSLYFQRVQGDSALRAGLAFVPMTALVLATNVASGRLVPRIGARRVILIGLAGMVAGCAGLLIVQAHTPFAEIVAQQVLLGGGLGLVVPAMTNALMGSAGRSRSGVASGTLNTARQCGSVLGVAVFGTLVGNRSHFIAGFHAALVISLALVIVAALLALRIPAVQPRPPEPGSEGGARGRRWRSGSALVGLSFPDEK
jgi:DHA2 family methylenomycin A resistance protein-like MFS transporter